MNVLIGSAFVLFLYHENIEKKTLKVSLVISLSVCHTTVVMNLDPKARDWLINVYLYSHYLYTWYCVDFQNWELVIMLKFFQALFSLLHK